MESLSRSSRTRTGVITIIVVVADCGESIHPLFLQERKANKHAAHPGTGISATHTWI
jgi:hypothetical protein